MSKYDVNYAKLAQIALPMCLRGKVLTAILRAMVSPLNGLHASLMQFRRDKGYRLTHTGQVFSLRNVLNDRFDPLERAITITEGDTSADSVVIHMRSESRQALVPQRGGERRMSIFRRGYAGVTGMGFWVNLPARLSSVTEREVRAVVNQYRLASMRFGVAFKDN
ncbi:MAG: hypothetical protein HUK01_07140 [Bacteroidaceae bacterium]|nr:hypothetical protein [Bacteroidaceae bacterium]